MTTKKLIIDNKTIKFSLLKEDKSFQRQLALYQSSASFLFSFFLLLILAFAPQVKAAFSQGPKGHYHPSHHHHRPVGGHASRQVKAASSLPSTSAVVSGQESMSSRIKAEKANKPNLNRDPNRPQQNNHQQPQKEREKNPQRS